MGKGIHYLEYYNDQLSQFLELLLIFGDNCNFKGEFEKHKISKYYKIKYDKKKSTDISKCLKTINSPDWLKNCNGIC